LRLDPATFYETFRNTAWPKETHLCYELELRKGRAWVPLAQSKGFLHNKGSHTGAPVHAEWLFLNRISSWMLDPKKSYRVTCYISWSPCESCAHELAAFLQERSHVRLRVLASRIYSLPGHEAGLRALQDAGARVSIMEHQGQRGARRGGAGRGRGPAEAAGTGWAGLESLVETSLYFRRCWKTFVDHQGGRFEPWDGLEETSQSLSGELLRILQSQG
ncbi:DNA dC-_dU-editing enzyme APOBEC-3G, partial [Galemys pyrenaicus]